MTSAVPSGGQSEIPEGGAANTMEKRRFSIEKTKRCGTPVVCEEIDLQFILFMLMFRKSQGKTMGQWIGGCDGECQKEKRAILCQDGEKSRELQTKRTVMYCTTTRKNG